MNRKDRRRPPARFVNLSTRDGRSLPIEGLMPAPSPPLPLPASAIRLDGALPRPSALPRPTMPVARHSAAYVAALQAGKDAASAIVAGIADEPHMLEILPGSVELALETSILTLMKEGASEPEVNDWRIGFIRGADRVVRPYLAGLQRAVDALPTSQPPADTAG